MKKFIDKLKQVEIEMSKEKSPFQLFALFQPEKVSFPDKWDLLVAANWIKRSNDIKIFYYVFKKLKSKLTLEELIEIKSLVLLSKGNPELENIYETVEIEHGEKHLVNSYFFNTIMRRAYFITSKKDH